MRLLIVTTHEQLGGAERLLLSLYRSATATFPSAMIEIATLYGNKDRGLGAEAGIRLRGIRDILFGDYDIIHTHLFLPALLVRLRRLLGWNGQWIHTAHFLYESLAHPRLPRWLDRHVVFPAIDHLIAVSDAVLQQLPTRLNPYLIYNGPKTRLKRETLTASKHHTNEPIVVGCMAMLRREKKLGALIHAIHELKSRGILLKLKIAGTGPEERALKALTRSLGLEDAVEFCGYIDDLNHFYSSLDLYVQPTLAESFCIAMWDAMQAGKPMVGVSGGFIPYLLADGKYGACIKVPELDQLSSRLAEAIELTTHALPEYAAKAKAGYDFWKDKLLEQSMLENYMRIYRQSLQPRICMISPIITHSMGGMQKQLLLQSKTLVDRGFVIYGLQKKDHELSIPPKRTTWSHVKWLELPGKTSGFGQGLLFIALGVWKLIRLRHRIELMHAHQLYSPALTALIAKWLIRKPVVVKVTASGLLGEVQELRKLPLFSIRKRLFRSIDRVIVLTDEMGKEVETLGIERQRIVVLPNGVAIPDASANIDSILSRSPDEFTVLYCGRLSTEKGLETLIEACGELAARTASTPKIRLQIVGGVFPGRDPMPGLKPLLDRFCDKLDIRFEGHQSNLTPYFHSANVFVLPSRSEGLSNALLEAIAAGLCCVVSDIPANRFVVEDRKEALLFRTGDSRDLCRALEEIYHDQSAQGAKLSRNLMTNARRSAVDRFSIASTADRLSRLYSDLLPSQPSITPRIPPKIPKDEKQ
jgi:glycosyltransferase involved in cell wall biosynthesis